MKRETYGNRKDGVKNCPECGSAVWKIKEFTKEYIRCLSCQWEQLIFERD